MAPPTLLLGQMEMQLSVKSSKSFTVSSGAPGTYFFLEIRELWADPRFLMGLVASPPGNLKVALPCHSAGTLHLLKLAPYGHFRLSPCLLLALKAHIRTRWYFIVFSDSTGCFCLNYLPLYHLLSAFRNSSDGRAICIYHHLEPAAFLTRLGFQTSAAFCVHFNNAADFISVLNLPVDSCTYQMWWA